jgi:hypothetical protein
MPQIEIPRNMVVGVELSDFQLAEKKVSPDDRKELLRASRAGEPMVLSVKATVFLQHLVPCPLPKRLRSKANANFSRFRSEELEAFAASFSGRLFLRDHDRSSMDAVGGRIVESAAVKTGESIQFQQQLELVKPWAIEDALDGTMQTFSIGWSPKKPGWNGFRESLLCSVCNASFFDCAHMPGDEIAPTEGGKVQEAVIVEALWVNVVGAETSEVAFPAVRGTEVRDIRAALSEARLSAASRAPAQTETPTEERPVDEILKALGLSDKADTKAALTAIAALNARIEEERLARAAAEEERDLARKERDTERATATAGRRKVLHDRALAEMLFAAGTPREAYWLKVADRDLDEAEAMLKTLEPVVAGGREMQARGTAAARTRRDGQELSASEKEWLKARGFKDEAEYRKYAFAEESPDIDDGEE